MLFDRRTSIADISRNSGGSPTLEIETRHTWFSSNPSVLCSVKCRFVVTAALLFLIHARAQETPRIRVPVRLVSVPVLVVSKNGKYIAGLSTDNFRVTDNGRPQTVTLDLATLPISLVVAVQNNQDVRLYTKFIAKVGALLDDSLAGATGQAALITYNDDVTLAKPFGRGDLQTALEALSPSGERANLVNAGMQAIGLLKQRPDPCSRVLLFIGQPLESGGPEKVKAFQADAERANVQIYALTLPILGRAFVSDSFSLRGLSSQEYKGGYKASVELTKAVPALRRAAHASAHTDAFSFLTVATGGVQLHFRKQNELENAIIGLGDALRSRYFSQLSSRSV